SGSGSVSIPGGGGGTTPPSINSNVIPGTQAAPACTPQPVKETGISATEVRIGQIVSDVSFLPAQLYPNHEGLQAYINLVNKNGGICGRKITIDYTNDNSNPAQHDYSSKVHTDFAFVANSSLIDSLDYDSNAPFNPKYSDNGEFVPDVGGLAYNYYRNQSPYFAPVIGALSPSLTGGDAFKYLTTSAKAGGHPCVNAGVSYLREPTGASKDSADVGSIALAAPYGGNLGSSHVKEYVNNLADPEPAYQVTVRQMEADHVNCVFTYSDLGSDITLFKAMRDEGVWPPSKCKLGPACFSVGYVPFAAYDPKFITDAGEGALSVASFLPHLPLNEVGTSPALQLYESALKTVSGARPSTFSLIGFASGVEFAQALQACGAAPTRACLMTQLRSLKDFTGAGLLGPTTPFRSTRVKCNGDCGSVWTNRGTFDFKWIFSCQVGVQVQDRNGKVDFYRTNPAQGFNCEDLRIARGTPG
ncbi:MAG: ABC transporter substrate-binding protein, partial [Acidimicrobiales bacterium]